MDFSGVLLLYILLFITALKGNSDAGKAKEKNSILGTLAVAYFDG